MPLDLSKAFMSRAEAARRACDVAKATGLLTRDAEIIGHPTLNVTGYPEMCRLHMRVSVSGKEQGEIETNIEAVCAAVEATEGLRIVGAHPWGQHESATNVLWVEYYCYTEGAR